MISESSDIFIIFFHKYLLITDHFPQSFNDNFHLIATFPLSSDTKTFLSKNYWKMYDDE